MTRSCLKTFLKLVHRIHVWYIYLHLPYFTIFYHILPLKTTIHVGKYTSPMDGMVMDLHQTLGGLEDFMPVGSWGLWWPGGFSMGLFHISCSKIWENCIHLLGYGQGTS